MRLQLQAAAVMAGIVRQNFATAPPKGAGKAGIGLLN
jgi:hypothetical protein